MYAGTVSAETNYCRTLLCSLGTEAICAKTQLRHLEGATMKISKKSWQEQSLARKWFKTTAAFTAVLGAFASQATPLDFFGQPPTTDPSAYTNQPVDPAAALANIFTLEESNKGSYELPNGAFSSKVIERAENVLPPSLQTSFNYPTNGYPSPMFGALPFTQKLLMFEEFGVEKLDPAAPPATGSLPPPKLGQAPEQDPDHVGRSAPVGAELEGFLKQPGIAPFPTQYSN